MDTVHEGEEEIDASEMEYVSYVGEHRLPLIMRLIDEELSEPYSIFRLPLLRLLVASALLSDGIRIVLRKTTNIPLATNHWLTPSMAFHKGKCVGTVVCKMGEHRNTYREYIAMLVVIKPYRGKGIAMELVSRSIRVMKELGCKEVTLEAEVTNKGAIALYARLGFIRAKRVFRYYLNAVDAVRIKLLFPSNIHPSLVRMAQEEATTRGHEVQL